MQADLKLQKKRISQTTRNTKKKTLVCRFSVLIGTLVGTLKETLSCSAGVGGCYVIKYNVFKYVLVFLIKNKLKGLKERNKTTRSLVLFG